ncbi:MAG TPA: DUF429 domain-containing protein [Acidimicrobiales bacterium]|nr:DUF429 domain-containing protein [Acidimicrobiales bacterium]
MTRRGPRRTRVLGVDGCRGGWVGVVLSDGSSPTAIVERSISGLAALAGEIDAIGIDIPIHLDEDRDRPCDTAARRFIRPHTSRVFNAPVRAVLDCNSYREACEVSFALLGKKISKQTWELVPKIADVESWWRTAGCPVFEVHPEAGFAAMAGHAIAEGKRTRDGASIRRALLVERGLDPPDVPFGAKPDDLLDACAAAWSTARIVRGEGRCLPDPPPIVRGERQAIWF